MPAAEIASQNHLSVEAFRTELRNHLQSFWRTHDKWKLAEIRCHAMAMELRLLRLGKEAAPDRPLESLDPPKYWLAAYRKAHIETVNQLRAVDAEYLLGHPRFPVGAIDWAVLKMDRLGLSHRLERP